MQTLHYMLNNVSYLAALTMTHLWLVAVAVALATLVGVPVGVVIARYRWLAAPLLGLATLLMTVPAIVLFGLLLPLYSLIGEGVGRLPALTAIFLYALLPIIRNTHSALTGQSEQLREAARGMGMTLWQRLRWLEIPQATPLIFAAIRGALVMNIGVMAIASVIGAGGLGVLVLNGINSSDLRQLMTAITLMCLLAIMLDALLALVQRLLTPEGLR